ncbi:MAG TPA: MBOAT family protein [Burkholderiales bacterium]|nr:MBOAT family protein [Burkholderiales bacterium]
MLFNSYEFLLIFLPLTAAGYFALSARGYLRSAASWLALASIVFYGYWSPSYVLLLLGSIAANFAAGSAILRYRAAQRFSMAKCVLVLAVAANLCAIGYFKYANFFVDSLNQIAHTHLTLARVVLPIGISFFTFTQIAFLVDTYQGKVQESRIIPYVLFVTYFPHLIAGPVLHHAEMMPQFARSETYRFQLDNFLVGSAFFLIGLFKKVVLADGIQPYVGPVFEADPAYPLSALEAWGGALAYTMQIYFDFSGYSDMALGLAKLFNVDLPLNFNSPYKATSITDFWRRWHMTLSRFLRDYLYIALGGNRNGPFMRYSNLMITMLLGGLWHGAGWTFVIWGGLHGIYLVVNHGWRALRVSLLGHDPARSSRFGRVAALLTTFVFVVIAWVFFRATSLDAALRILHEMFGQHGLVLPIEWQAVLGAWLPAEGGWIRFGYLDAFGGMRQVAWIAALLAIAWACPNSQTLIGRFREIARAASERSGEWAWFSLGSIGVIIGLLALVNGSRGVSEFIYFNF